MNLRIFQKAARTAVMLLLLFLSPSMKLWAQDMNKKFSRTTQLFLNEQKENALHPERASRRTPVRRAPGNGKRRMPHRLIASPDTVGGVAYISCFIHLADARSLGEMQALGVEVEETFDGLDFITARVPVNQLEALADINNVTKIKVAQRMRPLTNTAREATHVDDVLTLSPDAIAKGVHTKYDGTGVVLGILDMGIDFQHIAFKDKNGNSRIKQAYVYDGDSPKEYTTITSLTPTTDSQTEDHGTHTASIAGGSSVIVNGSTVTVTDDHANATYGGMAPGADLYLAGIKGLADTYLINALKKIVQYADNQEKPLVVSNSWGSGWGPRDGTGEWADLVGTYFGDTHPNRVILFAASNDAGHKNGNEGGGFFVKKSGATSSSPLGTIIRTDGEGGSYYEGTLACAWSSKKLNCKLHVLDSSGAIKQSWTVTKEETSKFRGLSNYYTGSMVVYLDEDNGKYQVFVYSEEGLENENDEDYTLAIEVYPTSGSADVNMWAGDWSFFTNHLTTSGHSWTTGTDDMCVSDEATIPNAISVGAYVTKNSWQDAKGSSHSSDEFSIGDITNFSSYATAEQSPTGLAYPWISAPGARIASGVNHYHTASIDDYSYYGSEYNSDLVVNSQKNPYAMMEGTSMATPVAAGIVALWLQAAQEVGMDLTVNDVKDIMEQTAIQDDYTTGANAARFGKGKIDALAGIQYILSTVGGPLIKATPKSIDFADKKPYATRTYTKTFTVKGLNLEGDITVTLADANGVYALSQTSIPQAAAAAGAEITITYSPLTDGTHDATITLTSNNATEVVVNLTATARPATPTIIAEPETLAFTTGLDEPKSLTIDILSEFLTGDISVSLSDANNVFSIDKTVITQAESETGATITVTFHSEDAGTFEGAVTLTSDGAEEVVIPLTAKAALMVEETVDFTAQGYSNEEEVAQVDGTACTISFDKGSSSTTTPAYYERGSAIRVYAGNTMTVASASKTIIGIALTFGSDDKDNEITTNVGSYSNGIWQGNESSVTFTVNGTSGHRRIQKVTVTFAGGDTPIPVTIPTLAVNADEVAATSAPVTWDACDGVTEYTLQLATDDQFSTGSTSNHGALIDESFEGESIPNGWKASSNVSIVTGKGGDGTYCIAFKGAGANLTTPLLTNPSAISFMYKRSNNTTEWGLDISYSNSTSGPWTSIGTISDAKSTWKTFNKDLGNVGAVYIKFTDTRPTGAAERYVDLIQITGTESSDEGSLILTTPVSDTSYTFTDLHPETTYYARVKGDAEWSNVVSFTTLFDDTPVLITIPRKEQEVSATRLWYDLQGRQLTNKPSAKGVYITNGRKVVVK